MEEYTDHMTAWTLSIILLLCIILPSSLPAGEADVTAVNVKKSGDTLYHFDVTVSHSDEGWDHYADKWEVIGPDGSVLGTRTLYHPHVNEQPFTRSLSGVKIPQGVTSVTVRAHDSIHEYGGMTKSADICPPTQNDVEGPYYLPGAPFRTEIAARDEPGEDLVIKGSVLATDCKTPLKEALVEVWQTDTEGRYYYQDEGYRLRGQMKTGKDGTYSFSSIKPGRYRIGRGFRPAHIHIRISHPGYRTLVTQLYFKDDPYLWPNDACGSGCRSNDPRRIIELQTGKNKVHEGTFAIILEPGK